MCSIEATKKGQPGVFARPFGAKYGEYQSTNSKLNKAKAEKKYNMGTIVVTCMLALMHLICI